MEKNHKGMPVPVNPEVPQPQSVPDDLFAIPHAFTNIDQIVNKQYLQCLDSCGILPCAGDDVSISETACFFPIFRIVFDKKEDSLQKLASVYAGACNVGANLSMIIRGYESGDTEIYLGVCCESNRINGAYPKAKVLMESFLGNFPGCKDENTDILSGEDTRVLLNKCYDLNYSSVASVSCIASLRDQQAKENSSFYQGLDKVIETMYSKDYTIVILARPLTSNEIDNVRDELETLYTQLSLYAKIQVTTNWSVAQSVSQSITNTLSFSVSKSKSASLNVGKSKTHTRGSSESKGMSLGAESAGISFGISRSRSQSESSAGTNSIGRALSNAISTVKAESEGKTDGTANTKTFGESIQITVDNKTISETLVRIENQLKRLRNGKGIGMFAAAAYILSPSLSQTRIAASAFKAVVSGSDTNLESAAMNVWTGPHYRQILEYLKQFRHPQFCIDYTQSEQLPADDSIATATPAVLTTSEELAILMGIPRNKISGIPVRESVGFERNVIRMNKTDSKDEFRLGKIYYLDHEEKSDVCLDLDSFTMHCFVTGTTGSGKSNTIYGLLNTALSVRDSLRFMVIEPVKGDYKMVFGHRPDVDVYGTNADITKLLRINPFRFHKKVHVLEHIDALIGIFNVCWPMEAAMPSVLKQAVERAYEQSGWNLRKSVNRYSTQLFPSFKDVLEAIHQIMDESEYSDENKGNYKGALCTRLEELMTGLNSMIFVNSDLTDQDLFEKNVIIDLSRLGSSETKSLIMGLLVMRLKEYRQSTGSSLKSSLKHITVLEEAHNLLKRTSTEQSMNSANVTGKAVEMLSNSLAEMRSTGEGFIIADQAPGLLDLSAIRNTNTKIVLRLPESSDRILTGNAISLNQEQIDELAKLPTGVAAVYQNDWLGAALTKIPYYSMEEVEYLEPDQRVNDSEELVEELGTFIGRQRVDDWLQLYGGRDGISRLNLSGETKCALYEYVAKSERDRKRLLPKLAYSYFNTREALEKVRNAKDVDRIRRTLASVLVPRLEMPDESQLDVLLYLLIAEAFSRDERYSKLCYVYTSHMKETTGTGQRGDAYV